MSSRKFADINLLKQASLLNAFPEMKGKKNLDMYLSVWKNLFLDSWGYSIRVRWLKLSVYDYIKYIKEYWKYYSAIANMDTTDVKETLENQKRIEWETWKKILPIYHASDFFEWNIELLENYLSNYDYIALWWVAGVVRNWASNKKIMKYLSTVFKKAKESKTKIHWFGMTSDNILRYRPFYSVDSTTWQSGCRYNTIYKFNRWKLEVRDMNKWRRQVWVNYALLTYKEKVNRNLEAWINYEKYITNLHQVKWMEYWL